MPAYWIRAPRFLSDATVDGRVVRNELVFASPEHPLRIELPEGTKTDDGLIPVESVGAKGPAPLKPHFVVKDARGPAGSKDVFSKPVAEKGKGGRASDSEP